MVLFPISIHKRCISEFPNLLWVRSFEFHKIPQCLKVFQYILLEICWERKLTNPLRPEHLRIEHCVSRKRPDTCSQKPLGWPARPNTSICCFWWDCYPLWYCWPVESLLTVSGPFLDLEPQKVRILLKFCEISLLIWKKCWIATKNERSAKFFEISLLQY